MDRSHYDRYLAAFTARDYDGVLSFWAEPFELTFAGYRFTRKAEVKAFYAFFHAYVDESITVNAYVSDARMVAMEVVVPLAAGQVLEIPQFIQYHLRDGMIVRAACAVA